MQIKETIRAGRVLAIFLAIVVTACPAPKTKATGNGTTGPTTPGFVGGGAGADLGEPDPAPSGTFGLAYLRLVHARIRPGWRSFVDDARLRLPAGHALNSTSLSASVSIVAEPKGKLVAAELTASSGNADFDAAALEIARDAGPYPLAARELVGDDGLVRMRWLFARDRRLAGVATASVAPARWSVDRAVPKFISTGDLTAAATRLTTAADAQGGGASASDAALVGLGRRLAVASLRVGLRSKLVEVQRVAVRLASEARAPELASDLRSLATSVVDHRLRSSAVLALGRIGGDQAVPLLLSALRGERGMQGQSGAAAEALVELGKERLAAPLLLALLDSPGKLSRLEVLQILARAPVAQTVPRLAAIVSRRTTKKAERVIACRALGAAAGRGGGDWKLGAKALRRGMASPDAAVRAACVNGLAVAAKSGRKSRVTFWKATDLLKKDRDQRVKAAAVRAAARFEPKRFIGEMYLLRRTKDVGVLTAFAESLAVVPGAAAYKRLVSLAKHPDAAVRRAAAASLAQRTEPGAKQLVAAMTADTDPAIRVMASRVADKDALLSLTRDTSEQVRFSARSALVRRAGQRASLAQMCREIAATKDDVVRARIAGAWLAGGVPMAR